MNRHRKKPTHPVVQDGIASVKKNRRLLLRGALILFGAQCSIVRAQDKGAEVKSPRIGRNPPQDKALREMQIYKLTDIGLEVWVENQPPWEAQTVQHNGRPIFTVSSPDNYHPPTAMTFASWPEHKVKQEQLENVAHSALRNAARNFGLSPGQTRTMDIRQMQRGALSGFETEFVGKVQGSSADVRMFFGLQDGRAPVVMTIYTLQGKMDNLKEVIRRSWDNVSYLN
jgi:hypothetical protein